LIQAIKSVVDLKAPAQGNTPPAEERTLYVADDWVKPIEKNLYGPGEVEIAPTQRRDRGS
jgi:hypothetical protein